MVVRRLSFVGREKLCFNAYCKIAVGARKLKIGTYVDLGPAEVKIIFSIFFHQSSHKNSERSHKNNYCRNMSCGPLMESSGPGEYIVFFQLYRTTSCESSKV